MTPPPFAPRNPRPFDRRDLLRLAASSFATLSLPLGRGPAEAAARREALPLSVGFLAGSEALPALAGFVWQPQFGTATRSGVRRLYGQRTAPEVVPAAGLPSGDSNLAERTITVRCHGVYPTVPEASWFRLATLDVLFPAPADSPAPGRVPFFAYTMKPNTSAPPARFTVPLGADGGLELAVRTYGGPRLAGLLPAGSATRAPIFDFATRFTIDWQGTLPILRRGVYLLALLPGVWDRPTRLPSRARADRLDLSSLVLSIDPDESLS